MLCVFSAEVDVGAASDGVRGYSSAAAERNARRELMPDERQRSVAAGPRDPLA
jgi:hypothetical protein